MSGHTLGPWHIGGNGLIVYSLGGYAICDVKTFHGRVDDDTANARLIAAAPELLEACKMALDDGDCQTVTEDWLRKAIAKAEGR
jgi:hypothetical protein